MTILSKLATFAAIATVSGESLHTLEMRLSELQREDLSSAATMGVDISAATEVEDDGRRRQVSSSTQDASKDDGRRRQVSSSTQDASKDDGRRRQVSSSTQDASKDDGRRRQIGERLGELDALLE